jgi:protease II
MAQVPDHPPVAPLRPVTDNYFGTKVTDPYRWMENRNDPEFIHYMLKQGAYTRHVLDQIPGRDKLLARIAAHTGGGVLVVGVERAGKRLFVMKRAPTEDTWKVYVRESANGARNDRPRRSGRAVMAVGRLGIFLQTHDGITPGRTGDGALSQWPGDAASSGY